MTTLPASLLPNDKTKIESFATKILRRTDFTGHFTQGKINADVGNDKLSYRKIASLNTELQFVTDLSSAILNERIQFEMNQGKKISICKVGKAVCFLLANKMIRF
jgi:hypothetical protein